MTTHRAVIHVYVILFDMSVSYLTAQTEPASQTRHCVEREKGIFQRMTAIQTAIKCTLLLQCISNNETIGKKIHMYIFTQYVKNTHTWIYELKCSQEFKSPILCKIHYTDVS